MTYHQGILLGIAVIVLGMVATYTDVRLDRLEDRPAVTSTSTTVATTTTSTVTVPESNVYRGRDGHCFGTSAENAERRGLKPDPTCPGSPA